MVGDINTPALEKLVSELAKKGKAIAVTFDLADESSIKALVKRCVDEFGGVDGVAIPGADLSKTGLGSDFDILHMDTKVWEHTLRVNLLGHVVLMREAIPHLPKSEADRSLRLHRARSISVSIPCPHTRR